MKNFSIFSVLLFIFTVLASCQPVEKQPLSMMALFSDHLVLQQQQSVPIWGIYTPGEKVTVSGTWGESITGIVSEKGVWQLNIPTPSAGGPYEMNIATADSTIHLKDVMIGEVWLASGQSNMEMPLRGFGTKEPIDNGLVEIENADYPAIRFFKVARSLSAIPQDTLVGTWQVCAPAQAEDFSATGYFFARKLHQELKVPIGIINASWGGTVAEAWVSKAGLSDFPNFTEAMTAYDVTATNDWIDAFDKIPVPENLDQLGEIDLGATQILTADFDDEHWAKIQLPASACRSENFISGSVASQRLNGVFWYRKKVDLPDPKTDYTLTIGAIDDADIIYFNGKKIGATWGWNAKREYLIPKAIIKKGTNTIAVKHFDGGGGSKIVGPVYLKSVDGKVVDLKGEWSGLFYADLIGNSLLVYGLDRQDKLSQRPLMALSDPNGLPASLYNAMIHPLVPYSLAGAIWYQGESNVGRAKEYEALFPALIGDWRDQWEEEFPFYFVQIAPYEYQGDRVSPALRDAQRKSLRIPLTGMAITMDIGDSLSIHPGNKQAVGDRLARLALSNDYKIELINSGPLYKSFQVDDGQIILQFEQIAKGLELRGGAGFEIAGADKNYVSAKAEVVNNQIVLSASAISNPRYARYGWRDYFAGTLFNSAGLPASSFTTED